MSRIANLILLVTALTLIFSTGCKEKDQQDADQQKDAPGNLQAPETEAPETTAVPVLVEEGNPASPQSPVALAVISSENESGETGHGAWTTDYQAAMKRAAAENKDMLLNFSGSDWCGWCIKLDEEVFLHKEFIEEASKDFVFVVLDFPQDMSLTTAEIQAQNQQLKEKYGQEGFPTIYLTDAKGRPYAQTGYLAGGPKEYLAHLSQLREGRIQFSKLMTKAESTQLEGFERAKLIDEAIRFLPPELVVKFYRDEIDKIIALDSDNKAGLRDKHSINLALWEAGQQLNLGKVDKAIELVDKAIADLNVSGDTAQEVYYFKAIVLDAKGDKPATLVSLNKAISVAPESEMAGYIKELIKKHFSEATPE